MISTFVGINLIQILNENAGFNECKSRTIILLMQYVIKSFLINEIHKNKFSTNIIETTIGGWLHVALIWDRIDCEQKKLGCLNT